NRTERHWVVGCPQRVDTRTLRDELANRGFRGARGPVEIANTDQLDRSGAEERSHYIDRPLQSPDALEAGWRFGVSGQRKNPQRPCCLDARRRGQDSFGDAVARAFVIGRDAAEPMAVFGA